MSSVPWDRIAVVILAGGTLKPSFVQAVRRETGQMVKATHEINYRGRSYLDIVISALRELGALAGEYKPLVLGNVAACSNWYVRDTPEKYLSGNVKKGLDTVLRQRPDIEYILFITTDIPLVTAEMIETYIKHAMEGGADISYPIANVGACEELAPGMRRTALPLKGMHVTGGNILLAKAQALRKCWPVIESAIENRKKPRKLAKVLGWDIVLKFVAARISKKLRLFDLKGLESRASQVAGVECKAVLVAAGLAVDIDNQKQWRQLHLLS